MTLLILNINRKLSKKYAKSPYKLGLFLMASLIILSASMVVVIPMDSANLFQNTVVLLKELGRQHLPQYVIKEIQH